MNSPTTIRDAIESAFEATEAQPPAEAPTPAPAEPVAQEATAEAAAPAEAESAAESGATTTEAQADLNAMAEEGQPRDESGKFKKPESGEITPGPKSGPKAEKAPASWRPEVREHWNQLPPEVRAEVARRETEVQRTLQETAEARKNAEAFARALQPYEAYIRAEGATPIQAIDNMMATAVKLRTGTAPELAQLVAGLVNQFGTGRFGRGFIEMLDGALAGQTPQGDPQQLAVQQAVQQQLAPMQQFMQQFQQTQLAQQQQMTQKVQTEIAQFMEQAEFGSDVNEEMADLIEVAAKRGRDLSLQDAYDQACMANPRIRAILQKRAQAQSAQVSNNVAQKARAAAVSVSGAPALGAPQGAPANDVRSAIEAAIAMTSR